MTNYIKARKILGSVIKEKGIENIVNADLLKIKAETGCTVSEIQNALNYYEFHK